MLIEVPDNIVRRAEANATDLRTAMAIQLYTDNRIDHVDACKLAGLSSGEFNRELIERGIPIQEYPPACLPGREAG